MTTHDTFLIRSLALTAAAVLAIFLTGCAKTALASCADPATGCIYGPFDWQNPQPKVRTRDTYDPYLDPYLNPYQPQQPLLIAPQPAFPGPYSDGFVCITVAPGVVSCS